MIVALVQFDNVGAIRDGYGTTFSERLVTTPSSAARAAHVVLHEAIAVDHEGGPSPDLCEGGPTAAQHCN